MSNEPKAGPGVDPEMLAAYIDRKLSPEQRAAVEAQLATDPDSYAVLVESIKTMEALEISAPLQVAGVPVVSASAAKGRYGETSPKLAEFGASEGGPKGKVLPFRRWVIAAGSLAAAAAIAFVIVQPQWLQRLRGDRVDPRLERLVAAVGEERYIEARLTGGFNYGPLRPVPRSSGELSGQNLALLAAAGDLQKLAESDPTPANLRAWGASLALLGQYDAAVQTLEAAVSADANNASSLSDLSAAYASRASALQREDDWPRALAAAERSLRLHPELLEALFNRALALQELHLNDAAARAWDDYLSRDSSPWRAAATQLRQRIGGSSDNRLQEMLKGYVDLGPAATSASDIVRADAQKAREMLEDQLLPRWADAAQGDGDPQVWLSRAEGVARALSDARIDQISLHTVELIRSATPASHNALIKGLHRWRDARAMYSRNEMAKMTVAFDESAQFLGAARSGMALWAKHYVVVGEFYAGRLDTATKLCRELIEVATREGHRPLRARLLWDLGTLAYQRARFEEALAAYRDAGAEFEALGEPENAAAMEQLTAESLARLGEPLASWRHHRKALTNLAKVSDPRRRHTILAAAGHSALNLGMPEAAFHLFDAAVPNALAWNTPVPIVEALLNRARANAAMGRSREADVDLHDAEGHLNDLTDPSMRTRFAGDLMLATAESRLESDPATARQAATAALQRAEVLASEYRVAALRLLEGRAALASGDVPAARASLEAGVEALESKRALVQQRALRVSFLDSVWDVYAELIRLEAIAANDPTTALSWVERSRGRMVLDELGEANPTWDIATIQRGLKPDEGILYFESHADVLLAWLVTPRETVFRSQRIARTDLKRSVARYRAALQAKDLPATRRSAQQLYQLLFEPLNVRGRGVTKVAIAPDATLEAVPFSALQDGQGEYLAEWLIASVVPSGSVLRALGAKRGAYERVQAIGQPTMIPSLARMLPPLPGANAELDEIAALYPQGSVLRGHKATAAAFVDALSNSDVVQFSGHALANPGVAWQARLVLTPGSDGDSGVLSLESLKPRSIRAHTVVLAACGTGLGGAHRGEGLLTLGRPLMAAGARAVVVSLWNVDDRAMRALTTAFHRHLATGRVSAAMALQLAQHTLMKSGPAELNAPWAWAALNLQGALD